MTVLQRQVRGHVVHGLVRNHHRGALEVQLGIHRPGQFQVKDRIWRNILTFRRCSPWGWRLARGPRGDGQVTHIQGAREELRLQQWTFALYIKGQTACQIAFPQGPGQLPHRPDVPLPRQMARESIRRLVRRRLSTLPLVA